jgi:beta-galactosidase
MDLWKSVMRLGVEADVISSTSDFSGYKVILAPMLYMLQPGTANKLKTFVAEGGQLLATYFTGYVDINQLCYLGGFPGDGLSQVFGVVSEEIDTLYPTDRNWIQFQNTKRNCEVRDYAEVLQVTDAEVLAWYQEDYYKDTPAITRKQYGKGNAFYVACRLSSEDMQPFLKDILIEAGISIRELPQPIEYHLRSGETGVYQFYLNAGNTPVSLPGITGKELLTDTEITETLNLEPYGVAIICNP